MRRYVQLPHISTRNSVEAIVAEQRLASAAPLINPSFTPTEPTSTPQVLLDALMSGDREALQRGWLQRNRRHPLQVL